MTMDLNRIFNPQNKFFMFMEKVMNLCLLGILWALFSLPVITVGASTAALFQYTLRLTRDEEGDVWKSFWNAFKKNFVPATMVWAAAAAAGLFLVADLYCCQFLPFPGAVKWAVRVLFGSLIFVYLLTIIYVFPLTAFFKISVKKTIKDAFVMAMGNLYVSVTVLVIYALCAFLTWYFTELFMIWFAFGSYLASLFLRRVFEKYMEGDVEIAGEEGENVNKIVKK